MSSTETDSSNEVELNGLGDTDPGLFVDLDVAAWAGSNPNKRKEPEPASQSISSNGDALPVSDVKMWAISCSPRATLRMVSARGSKPR